MCVDNKKLFNHLVCMIDITFTGWVSLLAAIATDVGAMFIVTMNGMKLLPSSRNRNCKLERCTACLG